jgi:hypothetical protein
MRILGKLWFMLGITIVKEVYKPTYNIV